MKLNEESLNKIATACVIGLLSWNVMTTHELAAQQSVVMYKLEQLSDERNDTLKWRISVDERLKRLEEDKE